MQVRLPLLSMFAATALSLGIALPGFARPAILVGLNPDSRINVRTEPTTDSFSPHYGIVGDRVEIRDQVRSFDGYTWYYISFRSGAEGWVRGDLVQPLSDRSSPVAYYRPSDLASLQSSTYTIRVYDQQGQMYMDVFNRRTGETVLNRAVAEAVWSERGTSYLNSNGDFCYIVTQLPNGRYLLEVTYNGRMIAQERGYQVQ